METTIPIRRSLPLAAARSVTLHFTILKDREQVGLQRTIPLSELQP
ncbi:MAG: hypothetical protein KY467_07315 [Gemmatimonadetes bacterium]|nr:hypothetical protein [Gemmatimonadota bacterium]